MASATTLASSAGCTRPTAAIDPAKLAAMNLSFTTSAGSPLRELSRSLWQPLQLQAVGPRREHIGWPATGLQPGCAVLATVVSA